MNWSLLRYIVDNADITLPNYNSPRFMFIPSFSVSPVAPVFFARYEPAKSAKKNRECVIPDNCSSFSLLSFSLRIGYESI